MAVAGRVPVELEAHERDRPVAEGLGRGDRRDLDDATLEQAFDAPPHRLRRWCQRARQVADRAAAVVLEQLDQPPVEIVERRPARSSSARPSRWAWAGLGASVVHRRRS